VSRAYPRIAFGPSVKEVQTELGSRVFGERLESMDWNDVELGPREREMMARLDHFYMATVSESGWPYVQYRGGPAGFLKVLSPRTFGFADFRGNMQYISTGNVRHDDRVALFLIDQAQRRRLKIFARAEVRGLDEDLTRGLVDPTYDAQPERAYLFHVDAFDWNCPQHITPRFSVAELKALGADAVRNLLLSS